MELVVTIAFIAAAAGGLRLYANRRRREKLLAKYRDLRVVELIIAHQIWQGMSAEQLLDSWGHPADIGRKVYRARSVETFKYSQTGRNRFRSRVTVENGRVIGWEQR